MQPSHTEIPTLQAVAVNTLLRCTRADDIAAGVFYPIQTVSGLWVLELGPDQADPWNEHIEKVIATLSDHEDLLKRLSVGSSDFTLHFSVTFTQPLHFMRIPSRLSAIAGAAGFAIEIVQMQ